MNEYSQSLILYSDGESQISVKVDHPPVRMERQASIDYLRDHGCVFVPDIGDLPSWLTGLNREVQEAIVKTHLDLMPIYSVRIPETATIKSKDLILLKEIQELKHLHIAHQSIEPLDIPCLNYLANLEVLTLIGEGFSDAHVAHLHQTNGLRAIDIQSTRVTGTVARELIARFPNAKIYSSSI